MEYYNTKSSRKEEEMAYHMNKERLLIPMLLFLILFFLNSVARAENSLLQGAANSGSNKTSLAKADLRHHKLEVAKRLPVTERRDNKDESKEAFSITGLVQNPIWITKKNLSQLRHATVSKPIKGKTDKSVQYTGVPVLTLLEIVKIQKNKNDKLAEENKKQGNYENAEKMANTKVNSDIVVSVKSKDGRQIVFLLDYLLQSPENEIMLVDDKNRELPELVIKNGNSNIFPLKDIISVDIMQFSVKYDELEDNKLHYIIYGGGNAGIYLPDILEKCKTVDTPLKTLHTGTSKNKHKKYSLYEILSKMPEKVEYTDIFTVISDNGDLASFSFTELEPPNPPVVIIQNKNNTQYSYDLVAADNNGRVRWIKNVRQIKRINLKQKPMIYVIGMGCGDISLLTNEAISYMGRADVFVCMEKYKRSFAGYMSGKPVLFDPFFQLATFYRKHHPKISEEEAERKSKEIYENNMQMIRDALKSGKTVALLEPGDPTIYGGWRNWLSPNFPSDKIKIIPGISSLSAANAALGEYDITETSIVVTEPETLKHNESLIKSAAETESTIVIFMGISRMDVLVPIFKKYYAKNTPVHLVFYAGITGNEMIIKTDLEKVIEDTRANKENFLGLIYIGSKLR
jgi:precorrin-4 methylase